MANAAEPLVDAIVHALTAPESPLRREGVELVVGFVLERPIRDFVDRDAIVGIVTEHARTAPIARVLRERGPDVWRRLADGGPETLGALVPDDLRARARNAFDEAPGPAGRWFEEAIDPKLVRKLVAPVLQDMLLAFTQRLPIPGMAAAAGSAGGGSMMSFFRERLERRAGQVMEASKAVLGGFGVDLDREIQKTVREFSDTAARDFRDSLVRRLGTPEGREIFGKIQVGVVERLLSTPLDELRGDVESLPWPEIVDLVPDALEHLRGLGLVRDGLRAEIDAWIATDGDRSVAEILDEVGILGNVRATAGDRVDSLARDLFASDAFAGWLARLLAESSRA